MTWRRATLLGGFLLSLLAGGPGPVTAGPAPTPDPRARILDAEAHRGPAEDLAAFTAPDVDPAIRRLAIRALGRLGETGKAPDVLAALLGTEEAELPLVLEAAGLSGAKALAEPVARHLESDRPEVLAAAAEALGRIAAPGASERLAPLLDHPDPAVRAAALRGLGRTDAGGLVERVLPCMDAPDTGTREAAAFAAWMLAGARRRGALAVDPAWPGDRRLVAEARAYLGSAAASRRIAALRVLAPLLPKDLGARSPWISDDDPNAVGHALPQDPEPRVTEEVLLRVLRGREGKLVRDALAEALSNPDPKVRSLALHEVPRHGDLLKDALLRRKDAEKDPRLREEVLVALARSGAYAPPPGGRPAAGRPEDPVLRQTDDALLLAWTAEGDAGREAVLSTLRDPDTHAAAKAALVGALEERKSSLLPDAVGVLLEDPDPYVRSSGVETLGKERLLPLLPALPRLYEEARAFDARCVRRAVVEAWGSLAVGGAEDPLPPEVLATIRQGIRHAALEDPSAEVRRAARAAAGVLSIEGVPAQDASDAKGENDWRGLPRPKGEVLGLSFPGEGPWLSAEEILRLADRIGEAKALIRIETSQGTFEIALEPDHAPINAANAALVAAAGIWDGTRWHRLVPDFVAQGGDPRGSGGGDAGWVVPDEVGPPSFVRGAVGLPTSGKDTGGCQLFVMLSDCPPLDGRYTRFAHVVKGMEVVDRLRVGDRIVRATLVPGDEGAAGGDGR